MIEIKTFTTTTAATEDRPTSTFLLDGVELTAQRPKGAIVLELAGLSEDTPPIAQAQAAKSFVDACLTPESREHVNIRLFDPEDSFDFADLVKILAWVSEEFTPAPEPPDESGATSTEG